MRVVLQSAPADIPSWMRTCLESARAWAAGIGADYRFEDDRFFNRLLPARREKTANRPVVASDLARLLWLREVLSEPDVTEAVWLDADMLVFDPARLDVPSAAVHAPGREVWIQKASDGRLKVWKKVHNAFLYFSAESTLLPFYIDSARRILDRHTGPMVSQLLGPKFLTALHNMIAFPVCEEAGMLSPPVMSDILAGGGPALSLLLSKSSTPPAAVNLSASCGAEIGLDPNRRARVCRRLLSAGTLDI